nr:MULTISPECIES: hypothetical protein [Kribbella]
MSAANLGLARYAAVTSPGSAPSGYAIRATRRFAPASWSVQIPSVVTP